MHSSPKGKDAPGLSREFTVHVLTKVFVVLATVLAVALSTLVIAYAVNTDRIQADYRGVQNRLTADQAVYSDEKAQASAERTQLNATIEQLNGTLAKLQSDLASQQSELATLRTERAKAENDRQSIQGKIAELGETVRTQATIISNYRTEVTSLRKNDLDTQNRALALEDRNNDLESQLQVLQQNYRALQEQLAEAKRASDAALAGRTAGSADAPFNYTGPAIRGRVEDVQVDSNTSRIMAKVNVGTNDRVANNMQFYVVRDGNFLGNLVVTKADLNFAVGYVNTLGRPVEIRPGDLISSRAQ